MKNRTFTSSDTDDLLAAKRCLLSMYLGDMISAQVYEQGSAEITGRLNEAQGCIDLTGQCGDQQES